MRSFYTFRERCFHIIGTIFSTAVGSRHLKIASCKNSARLVFIGELYLLLLQTVCSTYCYVCGCFFSRNATRAVSETGNYGTRNPYSPSHTRLCRRRRNLARGTLSKIRTRACVCAVELGEFFFT